MDTIEKTILIDEDKYELTFEVSFCLDSEDKEYPYDRPFFTLDSAKLVKVVENHEDGTQVEHCPEEFERLNPDLEDRYYDQLNSR